ncbi:winged helix-turn-helix domain-containing protein [Shewanella sp. SNU WT4]|uniref:winged helix-turn-helix domain-containing protein n=1 Tax=Shewanella sp. SNU WT4 TaxID=2590015 RepID=UPI00143D12F2|nr:winged helix-turn-helix domain-containing protein [Shewanella sp. SNU WT4]
MIGFKFKINDLILHTCESKLCFQDKTLCIEPRLVNLLAFLAQHTDTVFSREEIIQAVWDGAVVTEQVVTQSVFELRKILNECQHGDIIVTIPKRGYKLAAQVTLIDELDEINCGCEGTAEHNSHGMSTYGLSANQGNDGEAKVNSAEAHHQRNDACHKLNSAASKHQEAAGCAAITPFPSAPLSRALADFNRTEGLGRSWFKSLWALADNVAHRLLDVLILTTLVVVVGYLALYQSTHHVMPEIDNGLIVIATEVAPEFAPSLGYLAYGISQQLQLDLQRFSAYRTRMISANTAASGKELLINIISKQHQPYLMISLYSHSTQRYLYQSEERLDDANVAAVLVRESQDLLDSLGIHLNADQQGLVRLDWLSSSQQINQYLLAQYYINQDQSFDMAKGIQILDKLISQHPQQLELLAKRYIASAEMQSLDDSRDDEFFSHYGAALWQAFSQQSGPFTAEIWDAIALYHLYQGDNHQVLDALTRSQDVNGQYTALGYIIFGKLNQQGHPLLASEAFSQAYYLDASERTYLLCQHLFRHSELSGSAPILAALE